MQNPCAVCRSAESTTTAAPWPFLVAGKTYEGGAPVCAAHELVRACAVCQAATATPSDPICTECRAAVEF